MKSHLHLQLLRPKRLFLWLTGCLFYLQLVVRLVPAPHRVDAEAFQWFAFIVPLALGGTLAMVLHELMHRPFGAILPGVGRRLFWSHATVVGAAALLCALIAFLADRTLPVIAVVGIAAANLALALPLEPGWRWAGSRGPLWVALTLGLSGAAFVGDVKVFVVRHPWIAGVGGIALAAACFRVAFSRNRLRARANLPYTSPLTTMLSPEFAPQRRAEALVRHKISRAKWNSSRGGDSIVRWVRAVQHENFSQWRWGFSGKFFVSFLIIVAFFVFFAGSSRDLAAKTLQHAGQASSRTGSFLPVFLLLCSSAQMLGLPRPDWLYPLSRARRAQVAFAASAWQLSVYLTLLIGGFMLVFWLAAQWTGMAFDALVAKRFIFSAVLMIPFVPISQWGRLHQNVRNDQAMAVACSLMAVLLAIPTQAICGADWFSPRGLVLCALAIAASQLAYYAALRRFYREGDLLQRGTKRQNLSLI